MKLSVPKSATYLTALSIRTLFQTKYKIVSLTSLTNTHFPARRCVTSLMTFQGTRDKYTIFSVRPSVTRTLRINSSTITRYCHDNGEQYQHGCPCQEPTRLKGKLSERRDRHRAGKGDTPGCWAILRKIERINCVYIQINKNKRRISFLSYSLPYSHSQ